MVRIRYSKVNNTLVSKPMVAGHSLITFTLFPETKHFEVAGGVVPFVSNPYSSLPVLKMEAKLYAKAAGVMFEDEIRRTDREELMTPGGGLTG